MSYQFLNNICPVCKKPVGSYYYKVVEGKKMHMHCEED